MEQKLAEFRARRQAANANKMDKGDVSEKQEKPEALNPVIPSTDKEKVNTAQTQDQRDWLLDNAVGRWLASRQLIISNLTLLKVLLWLVLLGLFVELGFGLPFFVLSLFYWIYEGLRTPAAREPGEMSAYSVFNPDCQPLLGTLTAEQLEGEMGYRPLANR
ncbi:SAYSvFN domain-containing protein 1 [Cynoglossus semilaevis]|uniref:SAYSVFN motif domain containing 1 n=1 Tax=Cynoglossus semilaevis TaxID=244447 RepID=A0A3P8USF1_CYNSE|nr:SAYSvFN domain-containing protein 1 [Cynoglossus semilaevis]